jgi:glycerophosphoryl diester phosphodiesterase
LKKHGNFWNDVKFLRLSLVKRSSKKGEGVDILMPKRGLKKWLIKNRDYETGVWTVNKSESIKIAIKYEVNFITTDKPGLCLELLL